LLFICIFAECTGGWGVWDGGGPDWKGGGGGGGGGGG